MSIVKPVILNTCQVAKADEDILRCRKEIKMNFYRRVAMACQQIPRGKVTTYGQIALLCGCPRQARRVGYALGHGLAGAEPPAHRVVNHQGFLTGAAAFETGDTQRLRLEAEGVEVGLEDGRQRVDLGRFAWRTSLEDALALESAFQRAGI